ncbi:MAG: purine-binding chemotaxis protein CheW [Chitinispirillaceae bacterium]|nr:purine-binding chemotaxis protein CheW [Chitinispirillaceae bacterium]
MSQTSDAAVDKKSDVGERLAGKYLTFKLADEEYGLEILKVQEIIRMQTVTRVPRTPDYVRGVLNLRGKVIPVIDLRSKFGMDTQEDTDKTCIIVVQVSGGDHRIVMGVIIDEVREVLDIGADCIEDTPSFGASINTEFIIGIGKVGDNVKMLLDIDKVLTASEVAAIAKIN